MRKRFLKKLLKQVNEDDYFLTADVGYGQLEPFQEKLGDRFINVGIREQAMVGIATGIALSKHRVFTYTMCSFYLRALEQIRNDVYYHNANVKMIGVGIDRDYKQLGFTHWAEYDDKIVEMIGIPVITVQDQETMNTALEKIKDNGPLYIRVKR